MNKIALTILSGAIGLVSGIVGTYIFIKKRYENKYYEELRKAIDEECERLRENHEKVVSTTETKVDGPVELPEEVENIVRKSPVLSTNEYHERLEELGQTMIEGIESAIKNDGPQFIYEDEFRFLPEKYEIRELQYLRQDGTVLDENDEIVVEPNIYISGLEDTLRQMGDGERAFILVENMGLGVEIVILDGTYQDLFGDEL